MPSRKPKNSKSDLLSQQMLRMMPHLDVESLARILADSPDVEVVVDKYRPKENIITYPEDPVQFMTSILGYKMWSALENICYSVRDNKNTVVASGFGLGKCCHEDDNIFMPDGRIVKAKELVGRWFAIIGFDDTNWSTRPMLAYATDNGEKEVFEIKLRSGRTVRRTANHPLLKWQGWTPVNELLVGDKIAVPLRYHIDGKKEISDNEIKLLAYLITEGSTSCRSAWGISQVPGKIQDEIVSVVESFGCLVRIENNNAIKFSVSGNSFRGGSQLINPINQKIRDWKLSEVGSEHKVLPDFVFELNERQICLLLNRMMSGDGWVYSSDNGNRHDRAELAYATSSPELAKQVATLFARLGVFAKIRKRPTRCLPSYNVVLHDAKSILTILDKIDLIYGKEEASLRLKNKCIARINGRYYPRPYDQLPNEANIDIPKSINHYIGIRGNIGTATRRDILTYQEKSGETWKNDWANSDIGWDEILEINSIGICKTVAITVPETNAYITEVVDHNSVASAAIACWWLVTHEPAMVVTMAPTFSQVQSILWAYIRDVGRKAKLPGEILETPRWKIADDRIAFGISPRKSNDTDLASVQGRHNPNLLVIMDEAAGLPKALWDTVQGLVVGEGNRLLCIGNPVEQAGPFWNACNNKNWHAITISCLDHPNVKEGYEVIPGAVTRQWIEDRCDDWAVDVAPHTPDSVHIPWCDRWVKPLPIFQAKVLGQAPEQAEDQLIPMGWVELAKTVDIEPGLNDEYIIGLDPARSGGDDSALCLRHGLQIIKTERRKGQDSNKLIAWVQQVCNDFNLIGGANVVKIYVDEIGIGAGVVDLGRRLGLPVVGINFARQAIEKKRFANLRSQCWWNLREALRNNKLAIKLYDPQLEGDLVAPKYEYDLHGRVQLESKDDIRKRLGRSPDSGDALALTFALPWLESEFDTRSLEELTAAEDESLSSRWLVLTKGSGGSRWKS